MSKSMTFCIILMASLINFLIGSIAESSEDDIIWSVTYDDGGTEIAQGLAIDSENNVIVAGSTGSGAESDYVTIKYNSDGEIIWVKKFDGGNRDLARGVAVDQEDNIIISGQSLFQGQDTIYLIKYDPDGNILWEERFDDVYEEFWGKPAVDSNNNIIIVGGINSSVKQGFILKYDASGNLLWSRYYPVTGSFYNVVVDSDNNIIACGAVYSHLTFTYDYYVLKTDPLGNILWDYIYESEYTDDYRDLPYGLAIDKKGNIVITGLSYMYPDMEAGPGGYCTAKFDSNGNLLWKKTYGGWNVEWTIIDVAINLINEVYVNGIITDEIGSWYFIIIRYDEKGNELENWICSSDLLFGAWSLTFDIFGDLLAAGASASDPEGDLAVTKIEGLPSDPEDIIEKIEDLDEMIWDLPGLTHGQKQSISSILNNKVIHHIELAIDFHDDWKEKQAAGQLCLDREGMLDFIIKIENLEDIGEIDLETADYLIDQANQIIRMILNLRTLWCPDFGPC